MQPEREPDTTTTTTNTDAAAEFDAVIVQLDYAARQWADHHVAMSDLDVVAEMIEQLGGTFTVTITAPNGQTQTHTRTIT